MGKQQKDIISDILPVVKLCLKTFLVMKLMDCQKVLCRYVNKESKLHPSLNSQGKSMFLSKERNAAHCLLNDIWCSLVPI